MKPLPVIASGGIADGRGLVAALCLGAQAVSMGTRFVASDEAFIPRAYKERIVASTSDDTVYAELFDRDWPNAPHRVIRNEVVREWEAALPQVSLLFVFHVRRTLSLLIKKGRPFGKVRGN